MNDKHSFIRIFLQYLKKINWVYIPIATKYSPNYNYICLLKILALITYGELPNRLLIISHLSKYSTACIDITLKMPLRIFQVSKWNCDRQIHEMTSLIGNASWLHLQVTIPSFLLSCFLSFSPSSLSHSSFFPSCLPFLYPSTLPVFLLTFVDISNHLFNVRIHLWILGTFVPIKAYLCNNYQVSTTIKRCC
jgi:hypothetical protein